MMFEWPHPHHDPGGKVKLKLPDHVTSDATFSTCGRYRQVLTRQWNSDLPWIMFVGMNPSTADHTHDDPTVRKECTYARMWGYGGLIKCNVMDYRCTNPKGLLDVDVTPCSAQNLLHIHKHVSEVDQVVAAWGKLPPKLKPHADAVGKLLCLSHVPVHCLGYNLDGSPKHPLYVKMSVTLMPYPRRTS
jgi:hypothetical protein